MDLPICFGQEVSEPSGQGRGTAVQLHCFLGSVHVSMNNSQVLNMSFVCFTTTRNINWKSTWTASVLAHDKTVLALHLGEFHGLCRA